MPNSGGIGFSEKGDANQPSPSIWSNCPNTLIKDLGLGAYGFETFLAAPTGTAALIGDVTFASFGDVGLLADTDLIDAVVSLKAGELNGFLDLQTGATDNDAIGLKSEPFCKIVKNSGNKVWFETYTEIGAIVTEQGFFCGLTEEANQTVDIIAANVASLIATDSFVGGEILPADSNGFNIVKQKDGGTKATVLADATNSAAITAAGGTAASVVGDTPFKFGLYFDGRQTISYFINGYKVASEEVDSTYDQANNLCYVSALKTGAAVAVSYATDWVKYAYQTRA